jgi:hypothetical protein
MDFFWTILIILLVFIFVLIVLPNILPANPHVYEPEKIVDVVVIPTQADLEKEHVDESRVMLEQQFQPASDTVPVNYPVKPIGSCPYVKPPSTDLRMRDTPMCVSVQEHDMRLCEKMK